MPTKKRARSPVPKRKAVRACPRADRWCSRRLLGTIWCAIGDPRPRVGSDWRRRNSGRLWHRRTIGVAWPARWSSAESDSHSSTEERARPARDSPQSSAPPRRRSWSRTGARSYAFAPRIRESRSACPTRRVCRTRLDRLGCPSGRSLRGIPFAPPTEHLDVASQPESASFGGPFRRGAPAPHQATFDAHQLSFERLVDVALRHRNGESSILGQPSRSTARCRSTRGAQGAYREQPRGVLRAHRKGAGVEEVFRDESAGLVGWVS